MRPLLTIFCWKGDDERIDRHWGSWEKTGCDIILSFPVDAPCRRGGLAFELSQHHGANIMRRIFDTFNRVRLIGYDTYWFGEADMIGIRSAPIEISDGLHGFLWDNKDPQFKAKQYIHYAQGMNRKTLSDVCVACHSVAPDSEQGFQDRFLGMVCENNNIPLIHRADITYSRNALDRNEYFEQAQTAIDSGVSFVHGIKEQWQLDRLKLP